MTEPKQYWNNAIISLDDPTPRHYECAAINMNESLARIGKLPPEYKKHVFHYRGAAKLGLNGTNDSLKNCWIVAACCIVGDLPDSLTSRPEFEEMPWPKTTDWTR